MSDLNIDGSLPSVFDEKYLMYYFPLTEDYIEKLIRIYYVHFEIKQRFAQLRQLTLLHYSFSSGAIFFFVI